MRLTDCFMDVIAYVSYCLQSDNIPEFTQVKADILRLVGESEQRFEKGSFTRDDYDLARFAVCAWVDESLLGSNWSDKGQWLKEPLQRIYYQTSDAGELFFQRLNTLGPHQQHVREVYYLCLALGFSGQYCNEGDEFLIDQLKISNLKLLTGSSVGLPSLNREELFPDAYPRQIDVAELPQTAEKKFSLLTIISVGVPFILFLVLFVIYKFVLSSIGDNIISTV